MNEKTLKVTAIVAILMCPGLANAQFNTIKKKDFIGYEILPTKPDSTTAIVNQQIDSIAPAEMLTPTEKPANYYEYAKIRQNAKQRKKHIAPVQYDAELPSLTISNLIKEIRKNGIQHEKIVLAQAILETGWFTSSVCRNKHNLFGLTNPRTGKYYEFNHWTESVRAYYTKVQYKYKGGNYLIWLKNLGYAEDPRYVSSLIRILRQYLV